MSLKIIRQNYIGKWMLAAYVLMAGASLPAVTLVKNVNSTKPLEEKVVIFDKSQPSGHILFEDTENCRMRFGADGAIESKIVGNEKAEPAIRWKPNGNLQESFDPHQYNYMIFVFRIEGCSKEADSKGNIREGRPDNLWISLQLLDSNNARFGGANFADVAEDGKTPSKTTTLKIPMCLLSDLWAEGRDSHHAKGLVIPCAKTRPTIDRDFVCVIDRIALAE